MNNEITYETFDGVMDIEQYRTKTISTVKIALWFLLVFKTKKKELYLTIELNKSIPAIC
jgi:hypothetical protein